MSMLVAGFGVIVSGDRCACRWSLLVWDYDSLVLWKLVRFCLIGCGGLLCLNSVKCSFADLVPRVRMSLGTVGAVLCVCCVEDMALCV